MLRAITRSRAARLGLTTAVVATGVLALIQGESSATTTAVYTAAPLTGPASTAGYVVSLSGTGFANAGGTSLVHGAATGVKFAVTCGVNEAGTTGTNAASFAVVSATRLVVTAPSVPLVASLPTAYKICVFDASTNLLGSGTYTVYTQPAVTAVVVPAAGPAYGGNTITVVGTGFTSRLTATVGGVALSNVRVTVPTSFTATVPAHAASGTALDVVVTTEGGPSPVAASFDHYTYQNAISVSPTVLAVAGGTVLDIKGVGFTGLTFPTAKVDFVIGAYDATDNGSGVKLNDTSGTCTNVQVVSDTELICTAPALPNKAYTVTVISDSAIGTTTPTPLAYQTVVSAAATVTYAAF